MSDSPQAQVALTCSSVDTVADAGSLHSRMPCYADTDCQYSLSPAVVAAV